MKRKYLWPLLLIALVAVGAWLVHLNDEREAAKRPAHEEVIYSPDFSERQVLPKPPTGVRQVP